jgi:hypothetical protein
MEICCSGNPDTSDRDLLRETVESRHGARTRHVRSVRCHDRPDVPAMLREQRIRSRHRPLLLPSLRRQSGAQIVRQRKAFSRSAKK